MVSTKDSQTSLEDAFIKITFEDERDNLTIPPSENSRTVDKLYDSWIEHSKGIRVDTDTFMTHTIKQLHPNQSLVVSQDYDLNLLAFPEAVAIPLPGHELVTHTIFIPLARRLKHAGILATEVMFGTFRVAWKEYEFTLYVAKWPESFTRITQHWLLRDGEDLGPSHQLLMAAGAYAVELHEEVWVYNQAYWQKDHALWLEIQKASWDDVILNEEFKYAIKHDIESFFESEAIYKELAVPWKRGLIFYGPPGNGKTVSLKAALKASPHPTLYVKSFMHWLGDEGAMREIFGKARQCAPCQLIIEDLDSHINDRNRSFFLNELDGLEDNDGLLLIGTTNHFDRLDPSLSKRPSRFDRKYLFNSPTKDERYQYAQYWQNKLSENKSVSFPDSLLSDIAETTDGFSFAYLKEAFVSSLILIAGGSKQGTFEQVIKRQIQALREQLDSGRGE